MQAFMDQDFPLSFAALILFDLDQSPPVSSHAATSLTSPLSPVLQTAILILMAFSFLLLPWPLPTVLQQALPAVEGSGE